MKKLVREPLVHFLLIGAGLFLLFGWSGGSISLPARQPGVESAKIVVTQSEIDQMLGVFTRTWHRQPTELEMKGLIDSFVRDEIFYREAVAAGLDRNDIVISRRLRQKMEFIFEDISARIEPTDQELRLYMKEHADSYLVDPQIAFRHVYVNVDKRGKNAEADARQILVQLKAGVDPNTAGDRIMLDAEVELSPLWDIKKQFGEEFSRSLSGLKQGSWEGPIRSGYGLHLVYVTKQVGGRLPDLKEVRETVQRNWVFERQRELKDAAYAKIRERYSVVVEKPMAAAVPLSAADKKVMIQ